MTKDEKIRLAAQAIAIETRMCDFIREFVNGSRSRLHIKQRNYEGVECAGTSEPA